MSKHEPEEAHHKMTATASQSARICWEKSAASPAARARSRIAQRACNSRYGKLLSKKPSRYIARADNPFKKMLGFSHHGTGTRLW